MHRTKCTAVITSVLAPQREELRKMLVSLHILSIWTKPRIYQLTSSSAYVWSAENTTGLSVLTWGLLIFSALMLKAHQMRLFLSWENVAWTLNIWWRSLRMGQVLWSENNHSVFTLVKQKQHSLHLIHCVCHSLDIVAHKAIQPLPTNLDYMIRETYNWFPHSAKRQSDYNSLQGHQWRWLFWNAWWSKTVSKEF